MYKNVHMEPTCKSSHFMSSINRETPACVVSYCIVVLCGVHSGA